MNSNETKKSQDQAEELQDSDLDQVQGGLTAQIDGLKAGSRKPVSTGGLGSGRVTDDNSKPVSSRAPKGILSAGNDSPL